MRSKGKQRSLVKLLPFSVSVQAELSGCNSGCTFFLEKSNLIRIVWICLLQSLLTLVCGDMLHAMELLEDKAGWECV